MSAKLTVSSLHMSKESKHLRRKIMVMSEKEKKVDVLLSDKATNMLEKNAST